MKILHIQDKIITISDPQTTAQEINQSNSYLIMSFEYNKSVKELYLAPRKYSRTANEQFYKDSNLGGNVDLCTIPHGDHDDKPSKTLPLFVASARTLNELFLKNNKVLVNCNHGRSRSGSVAALFLMKYLNFTAENAIKVVTEALKERGFEGGIDIKGGHYGTYGEWLRQHEMNEKENKQSDRAMPIHNTRFSKTFFKNATSSQTDNQKPSSFEYDLK